MNALALLGAATLQFTPPTLMTDGSPVQGLLTFKAHYGCAAPWTFPISRVIGPPPAVIDGLPDEGSCWFVVTAIDEAGVESAFSNQFAKVMGPAPIGNPTQRPTISTRER